MAKASAVKIPPMTAREKKAAALRAAKPKTKTADLTQTHGKSETVTVKPPNFRHAVITIKGTAPYVQHAFSAKMQQIIREKHAEGSVAGSKRKRDPKDFDALYKGAMHVSREGWCGIPAPAFRNAMISACRVVGFKMTIAKLSIFIIADGFDKEHGTPLVKIEGKPRPHEAIVRNATGVIDLRVRPIWEKWSAKVKIRWDADQFSATDVMNLMARVGAQVGIGEGRPDSPNSNGQGWGTFEVVS